VNVIILIPNPILAQMHDLFLITASSPMMNDAAGPNIIRRPPRTPSREPHPKPGQPRSCSPTKIHGDTAKNKLVFPKTFDFIVLYSIKYI
jgi:hypothetical protein